MNQLVKQLLLGSAVALIEVGFVLYNVIGDVKQHKENEGSILRDSRNWCDPLYVNSKDSRFIVQKKQAGGYTINFGNPIGILITLIFLGLLGWAIYSGL